MVSDGTSMQGQNSSVGFGFKITYSLSELAMGLQFLHKHMPRRTTHDIHYDTCEFTLCFTAIFQSIPTAATDALKETFSLFVTNANMQNLQIK